MRDTFLSVLPSLVILGSAALAAVLLATNRVSPPENVIERLAASRALAAATAAQGFHFAEETMFDFHEALGAQVGLPGMSFGFFIAFNVTWLGIWLISIPGIRASHAAAFFAAWFLAIAGVVNGVAHPLLALAAGGYFPGLLTSPLVAVASIWLWRRLDGATRPRPTISPASL